MKPVNSEFSRFCKVVSTLRRTADDYERKVITRNDNHKLLPQGKLAGILGVTREHLNRVLNGKRESRSLLRKHRELIGGSR
jgi:hypothetical protein